MTFGNASNLVDINEDGLNTGVNNSAKTILPLIEDGNPKHIFMNVTETDIINGAKCFIQDSDNTTLTLDENEKIKLLLNVNSVHGYNIFHLSKPNTIANNGITYTTIPKGTWLYKASSNLQELQSEKAVWFSTLEVAKKHKELFKHNYILAVQVLTQINLIILNKKSNVEKLLALMENHNLSKKAIEATQVVTGINSSIWTQIERDMAERGNWQTIGGLNPTGWLLGRSRLTLTEEDKVMVRDGLCPIFEHEKALNNMDGYIAQFQMTTIGGLVDEELAVCASSIELKLSSFTSSLNNNEVDKLIKEYSLSSNTFYNDWKKKIRVHYPMVILSAVVMAYLHYRNYKKRKTLGRLLKSYEEQLINECKGSQEQTKVFRNVLYATLFSAKASLFFEPSGSLCDMATICANATKNRPNVIEIINTSSKILTAIVGVLIPMSVASITDDRLLLNAKKTHKLLMKLQKDEILPKLTDATADEEEIISATVGPLNHAESLPPQEVRALFLKKYPKILAIVFISPTGNIRSNTKDILRAFLLYEIRVHQTKLDN